MTKRIVIIDGHPDPDAHRYVHALVDAYESGARAAGHEVTVLRVASLDFPFLRSKADFYGGTIPHAVRDAQQAIIRCDHLVIVYPLWIGDMPALLKGFLEQLFRRSVAYSEKSARSHGNNILSGKSARLIITMAMPAVYCRSPFGTHTRKALERSAGGYLGISPVRSQIIGRVEELSNEQRTAILEQMMVHGRKAE